MTPTSVFFLSDPQRPILSDISQRLLTGLFPAEIFECLENDQLKAINPVTFLHYYKRLIKQFQSCLSQSPRILVLYLPIIEGSKVLNPEPSYDRLCAMLALSFPEILFASIECFDDILNSILLWDAGYDNLFDGSGARNNIRAIINDGKADYLPMRTELSLSIDDEEAYAQLHAYTAYRFGYRSVAISTGSLADLLLNEKAEPLLGHAQLTFEDLYISFPDKQDGKLSDLKKRSESWSFSKATDRIFVTSDHDRGRWLNNLEFLNESRRKGINILKLLKPHAGMFRLWESSGMSKRLRWQGDDGKVHKGYALNFLWPPDKEYHGDHSSPGTLKMIAEELVKRAEFLLPSVRSAEDAVKGAVLANEAHELLGTRTPTLAIEALKLKHHFEVLAECQFSGVEYHIPLRNRLTEIQRDVRYISQWFGIKQRVFAAMNAEMAILTPLVRVFREFGQYDEEQVCMQRVRHLHNTLWLCQKPARLPLWPVLRYLELLLSSFAMFAVAIMVWVFVLGILFWLAQGDYTFEGLMCGMQSSVTSFFSLGEPILPSACYSQGDNPWFTAIVNNLAILTGFAHLGVFISHLYSIISRR